MDMIIFVCDCCVKKGDNLLISNAAMVVVSKDGTQARPSTSECLLVSWSQNKKDKENP